MDGLAVVAGSGTGMAVADVVLAGVNGSSGWAHGMGDGSGPVAFSKDGAWSMGMGNGSASFGKDRACGSCGILAASEAPGGTTNTVLQTFVSELTAEAAIVDQGMVTGRNVAVGTDLGGIGSGGSSRAQTGGIGGAQGTGDRAGHGGAGSSEAGGKGSSGCCSAEDLSGAQGMVRGSRPGSTGGVSKARVTA